MFKRVRRFLTEQLRQGTSPGALATTCAVGVVIAIFPTLGATTLLCLFAGVTFKLNQPILQAINYALSPVQLLMIPVFLKLGAWVCRVPAVSVNPQIMISEFWQDSAKFFSDYGWAGLQAILAWGLLAPIIFFMSRMVVSKIIKRVQRLREFT